MENTTETLRALSTSDLFAVGDAVELTMTRTSQHRPYSPSSEIMSDYDIPENTAELFANGERSYHIKDHDQAGCNIFAMNLFLECVGVPIEMVECDDGTQVTLFDGKTRLVIDSGGLGDFHLHGYDVTILEENADVDARQ